MYFENLEIFNFFADMDMEVFKLTYDDYKEFPALTMELYSIYKGEKRKIIAEKTKG